MQADQWASPDMVQFLKEVKQLHSRKKGQAVPEAVQILDGCSLFPCIYKAMKHQQSSPARLSVKVAETLEADQALQC